MTTSPRSGNRSTVASAALLLATAFAVTAPAPMHAQTAVAAAPIGAASSASSAGLSEGEVRKVDRDQARLTLRHGPIDNLQMPAMTMVFRVADAKLLDGLKDGDKVRFHADRLGGAITITAIEAAR
jgi:Cu(I)/Ag(I) efflux system periplasmic protein CusF